ARFAQAVASQFARSADVSTSMLLVIIQECVFSRFQLHDHAGKTLRECVMDVARESIAFLQNGCLTPLFGKFIELNRQHRLVCKRLPQSNLLRPIRRPLTMTNPYEAFHTAALQSWNSQEL